jgi:hypothetical protein
VSAEASTGDITYCERHPNVETYLRCGRCGTLICPRCLVQTPVGARCPDCANLRNLPTFDVSGIFIARGLAAAVVSGVVVGAFWGYISGGRGFGLGFLTIFVGIGIGWAISEAVSMATNRKRSSTLAFCAIQGVIIAFFVHNFVVGSALLPRNDIWSYVAAVIAGVYASSKLKE